MTKLTLEAKEFIIKMREQEKPYSIIAMDLESNFQIKVTPQTIQKWYKYSFQASAMKFNGKVDEKFKKFQIIDPREVGKQAKRIQGIKVLNRIARNRGTKKEDIDYLVDLILTL